MAIDLFTITKKIEAIKKINQVTNSVKTISIIKISKLKALLADNKKYMEKLYDYMGVFLHTLELPNITSKKKVLLVFTSEGGMVGGFNNRCIKLFNEYYNTGDDVYVFGKKGYKKMNIKSELISIDENEDSLINKFNLLAQELIIRLYKREFGSIIAIYNQFEKQNPTTFTLFPINDSIKNFKTQKFTNVHIHEGDDKLLLSLFLTNVINSIYLESSLAENISKRNLMITSNDNIDKMITELVSQKNKRRQEMITASIRTETN